jgi:hypothetical protein
MKTTQTYPSRIYRFVEKALVRERPPVYIAVLFGPPPRV